METNFFLNTLPRATRREFDRLCASRWLNYDETGWYLAGGASLGLQLGHRKSDDLIFFTQNETFGVENLRGNLVKAGFVIDSFSERTIYANYKGANAHFVSNPYFIPHHTKFHIANISLLHSDDVAVMTLFAISQGGRKHDFIDLCCYLNKSQVTLTELIKRLGKQYPGSAPEIRDLVKALTYFDDAEDDPMPRMATKLSWQNTKIFLEKEVSKLTEKI